MARSRIIKPTFFLNEQLATVAHLGRLLFIGLWCLADRKGRLEERPLRIRAELFPYENLDPVIITELLQTLERAGVLIRYQIDQKSYIQIVNFEKHQNPHPREAESVIPPVPPTIAKKSRGKALPSREKDMASRAVSVSVSNSVSNSGSTPLAPEDKRHPSGAGQPFIPIPDELRGLSLYERDRRLCYRFPEAFRAWQKAYPGVNLREEITKAHAWEIANPERQKINRIRFLNTWLARVQDRGGMTSGPKSHKGPSEYAALARAARQSQGLREVGEVTAGSIINGIRNLPDVRPETETGTGG